MNSLDIVIKCGWNCDQADFIWLHYVLLIALFLVVFYPIYWMVKRFLSTEKEQKPNNAKTITSSQNSPTITEEQSARPSIKKSTKHLLSSISCLLLSGIFMTEWGAEGNGVWILVLAFINHKVIAAIFLFLFLLYLKLYFESKEMEKCD